MCLTDVEKNGAYGENITDLSSDKHNFLNLLQGWITWVILLLILLLILILIKVPVMMEVNFLVVVTIYVIIIEFMNITFSSVIMNIILMLRLINLLA